MKNHWLSNRSKFKVGDKVRLIKITSYLQQYKVKVDLTQVGTILGHIKDSVFDFYTVEFEGFWFGIQEADLELA